MNAITDLEKQLLSALKTLVADYEAIGDDEAVPDSINDNDHWSAARRVIAMAEGKDHYIDAFGDQVPL